MKLKRYPRAIVVEADWQDIAAFIKKEVGSSGAGRVDGSLIKSTGRLGIVSLVGTLAVMSLMVPSLSRWGVDWRNAPFHLLLCRTNGHPALQIWVTARTECMTPALFYSQLCGIFYCIWGASIGACEWDISVEVFAFIFCRGGFGDVAFL